MRTRWLLVLLLAATLAGCGKYGPPQRVQREPAPLANTQEAAPADPAAKADDEKKP